MNQTADGIVEDPRSPFTRLECIYIYSALTILTISITLTRSWAFFWTCMRASIRLHDNMFRSISRATMRFFNTNTSGRVLNRFSKDMGAVDEMLPTALIDCIQIGLALLGIIVVVAIANVWLLIPTVLVGIVFYYLRIFYLATSRSVKRLEGISEYLRLVFRKNRYSSFNRIRQIDRVEVKSWILSSWWWISIFLQATWNF